MAGADSRPVQGFYGRNARGIIVCFVLLLPLCIWGVLGAAATNSNDVSQWLPASFRETQELRWFAKRFGGFEVVVVSWPGCTVDNPRVDQFAAAARQLRRPAGKSNDEEPIVTRVVSGRDLLGELTTGPAPLTTQEALRRLTGIMVGSDHKTTWSLIEFSPAVAGRERAVLDQIKNAASQASGLPPAEIHIGGTLVQREALDRETDRLLYDFAPIAGATAVLLAWWCLAGARFVAILFFTAVIVTSGGLAVLYFTGGKMNSMLMLLPGLWFVLAVSGGVHLINYYRDAAGSMGNRGAAERAMHSGWLPCALATLTTCIGLGSLAISDIEPVKKFGIYSALGLTLGLVALFLLLPSLLQRWPPRSSDAANVLPGNPFSPAGGTRSRRWGALTTLVTRHPGRILIVFLGLIMVLGCGLVRLQTSSKLKDFFRRDSRIFRDYAWLERNVAPLVPVDIAVRFARDCELSPLDRLRLVAEIEQETARLGASPCCLSAATFVPPPPAGGGMRAAARRAVVKRALSERREELVQSGQIRDDGREEIWRVSARIAATGDRQFGPFLEDVRCSVEPLLQKRRDEGAVGLHVTYTGIMPATSRIQAELWTSLIDSLWIALLLICIVMIVALKSVTTGLLAMLPNVFPLITIFGMMGWLGTPLDIGAMMTGSIALGIAVDDTFHFLIWFGRGRRGGQTRRAAILTAYQRCGAAMIYTSVICGCSMLVYLASGFVPAARFGGLMFTLIFAAILGDFFLLPALLMFRIGGRARR